MSRSRADGARLATQGAAILTTTAIVLAIRHYPIAALAAAGVAALLTLTALAVALSPED